MLLLLPALFALMPLAGARAQASFPEAGAAGQGEPAWLWRQALGGAVQGQPAVHGQSVAMVLDGGSLRAHSLSGRPLWSFSARGRLSPFLARSADGVSYIGRASGALIAVNGSGREIWRAGLGDALFAAPVLGLGGRVFAATSREIFCFTASGTLLWRRRLCHAAAAGPWPDGAGGVLLALESGEALRIGPFGEACSWMLPAAPAAMASVARPSREGGAARPGGQAEGLVFLAFLPGGEVWAIDPSQPEAPPAAAARLPGAPVAAAGRGAQAVALLADGRLAMLCAGGEKLWSADSRVRAGQSGPGAPGGGAALAFDERGVFAFAHGSAAGFSACGQSLWRASVSNASGIPAMGSGGELLSGGADWILHAWAVECAASAAARAAAAERAAAAGGGAAGLPVPPSPLPGSPPRFAGALGAELEAIRGAIRRGSVGEREPEWIALLKETAAAGAGGSPFAARQGAAIGHRMEALRLLGLIGSGDSVPWLARFFAREREPALRAAAAAAIGGIGFDRTGLAMREFAAAASPGSPARDEQVLLSVAAAVGALCRMSGPPSYEAGARALVILSGAEQPPSVRRRALAELESLRPAQ